MLRLNSYRPLRLTKFGLEVARKYCLDPFIDGSIRREPDFENEYPSITGLCRLNKFAPTLRIGDSIAYITVKGKYGLMEPHWRLVGILTVIEKFTSVESHNEAFKWYESRGISIPKNCMAFGNPGADFEKSSQQMDHPTVQRKGADAWEAEYRMRSVIAPAFVITKIERLDLKNPPVLLSDDMRRIFDRIPGTQNPPYISEEQLSMLRHEFDKRT